MAQMTAYALRRIIIGIIAILVAAALVIGIVYFVAHRGEQVRHDQATKLAAQELQQQQKADAEAAANTATKPTTVATTTPGPITPSAPTATTATELPVTGISDAVAPMLILAILAFAATSYVSSRQRLKATRLAL